MGTISNATPTQNISTFVERLYTNVLGRPSDASGLTNWVNVLQTSNASDVAKSFFNSQEFLNANYSDTAYVQKLYTTFLDRTYDEGGLTHWLSQLSGGMSRSAVLDGFAQSSEFATIAQSYGIDAYESGGGTTTPSNPNLSPVESFVERFYTEVLGRASDASGLASWSTGLENGSKTADDIAQGFFFSQEFINRNLSNSDFIDVAYETLLNRQADSGGKASWLTQLNGGMSRSTMLDGFIYSAEFDSLADSYGIEVGNEIEYTIVDESSYDGHTLAIDTQGDVYAWGDNQYGQIGDGTVLDRDDPVQITTLSNIKFVEAGAWCSFAITNSGDVYAWGSQTDGMLGDGVNYPGAFIASLQGNTSLGYKSTPIIINGLSDIIQIDSGFDHVLAVDSSGNVYGWGENHDGQLGPLSPGANQTTPLHLGFVSNIVEVSAGTNLSIALDNQGKIFYWGDPTLGYDPTYAYPKTISSNFTFTDIDETTLIDTNGVQHSFYDFV